MLRSDDEAGSRSLSRSQTDFPYLSDADDDAMKRYKESLGLSAGTPTGDPKDPRTCIIKSLALVSRPSLAPLSQSLTLVQRKS